MEKRHPRPNGEQCVLRPVQTRATRAWGSLLYPSALTRSPHPQTTRRRLHAAHVTGTRVLATCQPPRPAQDSDRPGTTIDRWIEENDRDEPGAPPSRPAGQQSLRDLWRRQGQVRAPSGTGPVSSPAAAAPPGSVNEAGGMSPACGSGVLNKAAQMDMGASCPLACINALPRRAVLTIAEQGTLWRFFLCYYCTPCSARSLLQAPGNPMV